MQYKVPMTKLMIPRSVLGHKISISSSRTPRTVLAISAQGSAWRSNNKLTSAEPKRITLRALNHTQRTKVAPSLFLGFLNVYARKITLCRYVFFFLRGRKNNKKRFRLTTDGKNHRPNMLSACIASLMLLPLILHSSAKVHKW